MLALEHRADFLLVDERRGRRIALEAGVPVIGLLGVIVRAKRTGLIESARQYLMRLSIQRASGSALSSASRCWQQSASLEGT